MQSEATFFFKKERLMDFNDLQEKLEPMFEGAEFYIADMKVSKGHGKTFLQIFLDRNEGNISLEDCGKWSDKIGSYIDMNNIIEGGYILEVSSPGVDRIIRKERDFRKFTGHSVKITLKKPLEGTRVYYSRLTGYGNNAAFFEDGLSFSMEDIQEIRLNPDYDQLLKKHPSSS
ncbi:MAG: hypothetical protein COT17_03940 [Elusimicrobia bacterium CG08_land_8_20_14_0_20_51_18]|nr:MAG: hypothetical protein COT17_03940 [Elusimicrobia bacterium CG08_land_8_20_14_0_20_51_18]